MPIIQNNTLSSIVNLVSRANPIIKNPPLSHRETPFTLDSSGIVGFFGGESAVRATATVNLVAHRRWYGWYNAPGSYDVARQYSALANVRLFEALFPSSDSSIAKILMIDGRAGPEHTPLYSAPNTAPSSTKHLGSLIARTISQMSVGKGARETTRVTFIRLDHTPDRELTELNLVPNSSVILFGIITILISIGGCIGCILVADWFCLASIALGMIANGMACVAIGSGKLYLKHNSPAEANSPGDVLLRTDTDIIVLVGTEGSLSPIIRGRFELRFRETRGFKKERSHRNAPVFNSVRTFSQPRALEKYLIDFSVILLLSQFLGQLLLIPQGTLFGQLMFVGTLLVSWIYNSYLSSISLDFQTTMLFQKLKIDHDRIKEKQYTLDNWTQAVVFACLSFRAIHPLPKELRMKKIASEEHEAGVVEEAAGAEEAGVVEEAAGAARVDEAKKKADEVRKKLIAEEAQMKDSQVETRAQTEYDAFRKLLEALLPEEKLILQAFKGSLVRMISKTDADPYADKEPPTFKFTDADSWADVGSDQQHRVNTKDKRELVMFWDDAKEALTEWRKCGANVNTNMDV